MKVDAIGLICPEPIMLLHKAIHESNSGDVVELIATDPVAKKDVEKLEVSLDTIQKKKILLSEDIIGEQKNNIINFHKMELTELKIL